MNLGRLWAMARKEVVQLRRDTRSLVLAFLLPVLLLVLFGHAISFDVTDVKTAVLDEDRGAAARELRDAFGASGYFTFVAELARPGEIGALLDRGDAQLVLVIPPDFSRDLNSGRPATVQAIVDGSDANTATIVLAYTRAIALSYALKVQLEGVQRAPAVALESRVWFNEQLTSRNMIVPGLVAVIMMIVAALLTSLTIAREWERGSMEQLASTPVSRAEVVLGKLLPYVLIGLVDVAVCALLGVFLFGVPFRGSALLLLVASTAFLLGGLGLGIFISAVTRSQLLASQLAMVVTFLPAFLLSGFLYAIANMPALLQAVTLLVPARYFVVVTRGVFLKGVGVEALYMQGVLMLAFAAVGVAAAMLAFRKELPQ